MRSGGVCWCLSEHFPALHHMDGLPGTRPLARVIILTAYVVDTCREFAKVRLASPHRLR
jgi:hypothetical protein